MDGEEKSEDESSVGVTPEQLMAKLEDLEGGRCDRAIGDWVTRGEHEGSQEGEMEDGESDNGLTDRLLQSGRSVLASIMQNRTPLSK